MSENKNEPGGSMGGLITGMVAIGVLIYSIYIILSI